MGRKKLPAGEVLAIPSRSGYPASLAVPARKHYSELIACKATADWQPAELTLAEKLANAIAQYERMEAQAAVSPLVVDGPSGPKPHPVFGMVKQQASIVLGLRRALFRRDNPAGVVTVEQDEADDLL